MALVLDAVVLVEAVHVEKEVAEVAEEVEVDVDVEVEVELASPNHSKCK